LTLVTDDALAPDALVRIVERACSAGRVIVQLRAKNAGGRALLALARRLGAVTSAAGSLLVVNDRVDVALASGAGGVHLPAAGMASDQARALIGPKKLLGRSVHSLAEIDGERATGAVDYVQFGPTFATPSKAAFGPPPGLEELARAVERARPLPVVAGGGIDATNAAEVMRADAAGIAVIRAVMRAADAAAATSALFAAIRG
jgi:thiamine-phosphate pyrophosphorylase